MDTPAAAAITTDGTAGPQPSPSGNNDSPLLALPADIVRDITDFLPRESTVALAATCRAMSALLYPPLWRADIATGAYDSARWALCRLASVPALRRAVLEHGADPNRQLGVPGVPNLASASLVGLAAWYRLEEPLRWLVECGGGDVGTARAGVGTDRAGYGAVDMALMGSRSGGVEERCAAPTVLYLLEHGADAGGWRTAFGRNCATPVLEWFVQAHLAAAELGKEMLQEEPTCTAAWIDDAIDFALISMSDPVPAFLALVKIRPSDANPASHPLVKCVHTIVRQYTISNTISRAFRPPVRPGLLRCFRQAALRLHRDPTLREVVPHAYNALARWVLAEEGDLAAADVRDGMFKLLLERTRVHPDETVDSEPSPLFIELQNVIVHGTRDLRCIGLLLLRGADPLWSWGDHEEGYPRDAPVLEMLIRVLAMSSDGGFTDGGWDWKDWIWFFLKKLKWAMTPCQWRVMELVGEILLG
ncbi:hypothetical protein NEMBOFW57_002109 [Staphylotrichum longicolle]|uniref:F-box domain-containing protein n=1 Tax=Staphylotrichum longicolle TaxID=669026 RepID=A0AAD4F2R8_9PEZI|nr:hypothetical protein NEMBOFW57_002109 [Staphylotrichum longicolle]